MKFVERCHGVSPAEAGEEFLAIIRKIGFSGSACGAWAGIGRHRQVRFFFVDWPRDWLDFYQSNQSADYDVLPIEARRRVSAFWYSEIISRFKLSDRQKQLYEAGVAYGWKDVFAVPIHGPGSLQGLVTMATREELGLKAADCIVLEMMARTVWERCRTLVGFGVSGPDQAQLSPREIECLQWAAVGKSDADIAAIIGISPATVHFHVEQAKRRLGVRTRVEAVAMGVLHGLI